MIRRAFRYIGYMIAFFFISSFLAVVVYKYVPVYLTPLMVIRYCESIADGKKGYIRHMWVPLNRISPSLAEAVVASEDNLFTSHSGFDFKQIKKVLEENKKRKIPRGASTISQQTAKNVFLWPGRSYFRKGLEAYFTFLIEHIWGKKRIMEVYLNSIEIGTFIYGAEAVAQLHFKTHAENLTKPQCALIAATLPNPRVYNSAAPSEYMLKRQKQILSLMNKIGALSYDK